ncbi:MULTISPECIES: sugar kinase [Arthrobacter]|uniref:Carbohydrate kinase n=1 Tax=Arthrobacter psychrochitiniphilus TaxID=291045 RepID=A0A2V3DTR5_9MICC|nr:MULTISPECIES: sugar kinase [Arthrobacter]NYG18751.1 2-dehydro-3-deoxygluconokinase [Arthrobacter psychrochitiniphilus]PXA66324.1 carbohydrate kinase [Arthrobacter psychrochitiniphilus]
MIDVVAVGETMAVVTPTLAEPLEMASGFSVETAGAESNLAQWLADWGHSAAWVSRVGNDPLGRRIVRTLKNHGVNTTYVSVDPQAPTGVMFKDPGINSTTVHYYRKNSAAALMGAGTVESLPWGSFRLLHLTGITPALSSSCAALVQMLFDRAKRERVPVSFDVNYRPGLWGVQDAQAVLLNYARQADYTFVGLDEAQVLWPGLGSADDVRELIPNAGTLIIKDGALGATEFNSQGSTFVPAPLVQVVEAVGAGDAFAAGYLSAVLENGQALERLQRGHQFAARALASTLDFQPSSKEGSK